MAQTTTRYTRFVGTLFTGAAPPTTAELGRTVEAGDIYLDTDTDDFCWYTSTGAWHCVSGTANLATTTSTTTTTSTSTSTTAT